MRISIIGGDQNQYGPVDLEQARQWVREGRANGKTRVRVEGEEEWRDLDSLPELRDVLGGGGGDGVGDRDAGLTDKPFPQVVGHVGVGACVQRGFQLFSRYPSLLLGTVIVLGATGLLVSWLSQTRHFGLVFELGGMVVTGPLLGGAFFLILKAIRGQDAEFNDLFAGFRGKFGAWALAYLVPGLITAALTLPALGLIYWGRHVGARTALGGFLTLSGGALAVFITLAAAVLWLFVLPLAVDRGLPALEAMRESYRAAMPQSLQIVALLILVVLLNVLGLLLCGVGLLISAPVSLAAMLYAYEDTFGHPSH